MSSRTPISQNRAIPHITGGPSGDSKVLHDPPKKLMMMLILEILQTETDPEHHLRQSEIVKILDNRYDMQVDRKAVKRNIDKLIEMGFPISGSKPKNWSKGTRPMMNPETGEVEEQKVMGQVWYEHDFTTSELRILIDSLLFSKHLPYNQCRELVEKLARLSSKYFKPRINHIYTMPDNLPPNPQLDLTIEVLDEAITKGRKVAFHYLDYATDKKQYPRRRDDGTVREYIVSPYQMAVKEGKYYLICNYDKFEDASNYRVDRITDIRILKNELVKPFESLRGSDGVKLDLAKYMQEHIYMYSSPNTRCKFRIVKPMIADVIDMFGRDVEFSDETDKHVTVTARVNERAMWQFAKNFAPDVLILEPKRLADQVREEAERTVAAYREMER